MVSLGEGTVDNRGQRGGYFFNDTTLQSQEDEELLISHNLQADEETHFKKLYTLWMTTVQIILILGFLAFSFVLPYAIIPFTANNATSADQLEAAFTYVAFGQPVVWFLLLLADRYLQYRHTLLRRHGYLEFTHKTRFLRRTPEFMFSLGNAMMVIVIMLRYKVLDVKVHKAGFPILHGINYQEIVIGLEASVAFLCCIRYAMLVYRFNREHLPPDAEQEEQMIAVMQPSTHLPDVGYRDNQYVDSLLERQADMIRYLKHHTEYLSKCILKLRAMQHNGQLTNSVQA